MTAANHNNCPAIILLFKRIVQASCCYLLDSAIRLVGYIVMVFCDFAIIYTFDKLKYINEHVKYYAKMKAGG